MRRRGHVRACEGEGPRPKEGPRVQMQIAEAASAVFAAPGPSDRLQGRLLWQGLGCDENEKHSSHEPGSSHFVP